MNEQGFDELLDSVRWMGRHMRSEDDNGRTTRIPDPDVKAIRETTGLSQSQFALMIGVKLKTLQNWEQKRVRPAVVDYANPPALPPAFYSPSHLS